METGAIVNSRYRVERKIGTGAAGSVWLAQDTALHRQVALKFCHPNAPAEARQDTRALREARTIASLHHPAIVQLHDFLADELSPVLVMQYIDGPSLEDALAEGGPWDAPRVRQVAETLTSALIATHALGIVHRDIKPGNILIDPSGSVYLGDFGLALARGNERLTMVGNISGTLSYVSPDLLLGEEPSPASDMWALGVTLFQAATGDTPFSGAGGTPATMHRILTATPRYTALPGELRAIIEPLLAKEPADRPSAADYAALLDITARPVQTSAASAVGGVADEPGVPPPRAQGDSDVAPLTRSRRDARSKPASGIFGTSRQSTTRHAKHREPLPTPVMIAAAVGAVLLLVLLLSL